MEASSPLSSAWSQDDEDDYYANDIPPVSMVEAPECRMDAVHVKLTPRHERSFIATSVAPVATPTKAAPEASELVSTASQQKPVTDEAGPQTSETSPALNAPSVSDVSSHKGKIGPVPRSYTANAFSLAPPSTPPRASSITAQSKHEFDTASIPETPGVPETPGLSEIAETPTYSQTPARQLPGSRERSRQACK